MSAARGERGALLARLHIARKQLRLDDDTYRDVLERVAGQRSSTALDVRQIGNVLDEMRRLGWKSDGYTLSRRPNIRMIYGIWKDMRPMISDGSRGALRAFCRRMTGSDAVEFLDDRDANIVIEGLKAWRTRLLNKEASSS